MVLVLILAALAGGVLGLLGGGGSILMVPILAYVGGASPRQAIASSLFVVAVTSGTATIAHARAGRVMWRTALVFGTTGMIGAAAGGRVAGLLASRVLMLLFAGMMLATAIAMMRPRRAPLPPAAPTDLAPGRALAAGLGFGFVTGLVGAGGGFLIVPALVLLGGLPFGAAVATSLVVIAMTSAAGLATRAADVDLDWTLTLAATAAAIAGSFAGAAAARRVPPQGLRRGFGGFLIAVAVLVLVKELA